MPRIAGQVGHILFVGATASRQERFKIAQEANMKEFIGQCSSFEHTVKLNRQQVESR